MIPDTIPGAVRRWLDGYRTAWVDRDPDAAAALFTDDALYREQPYEEPFRGPQGVREYWARVTATQAQVELDWGVPVVDGDRTAVEWWVRFTSDGERVTLAGSMTLLFAPDGRCRELREYWHFAPGHHAAPEGWGA
jgi:ketosteroid isomerase-like protein